MIYMTYAVNKSQITEEYKKQLPENLKAKYEQITSERTRIYYQGYILGFILSFFIIMYNSLIRKKKITIIPMVCLVASTSFIVNYFYYVLSPKSDYMLNHIETKEQNQAWLNMYRGMQLYYHTGLVLGIFSICFIAIAFR
jgi:glucan phosphoethanolaminetransferase (alkaline phosphatase superfamily)